MRLFESEEEVNSFLGIEPISEPDLNWVRPQDRTAIVAVAKLFNVHAAHNQANGFVSDWSDSRQYKYSAWHWIKRDEAALAGFGFSDSDYDGWDASTTVGSRLCVGTSEEALHIAKTFGYLYADWYFITPLTETTDEKN